MWTAFDRTRSHFARHRPNIADVDRLWSGNLGTLRRRSRPRKDERRRTRKDERFPVGPTAKAEITSLHQRGVRRAAENPHNQRGRQRPSGGGVGRRRKQPTRSQRVGGRTRHGRPNRSAARRLSAWRALRRGLHDAERLGPLQHLGTEETPERLSPNIVYMFEQSSVADYLQAL